MVFYRSLLLGPDFAYSWNNKSGKKFQSKKDQVRMKLALMAHNIYCKYFKNADMTPHGSIATLHKISKILNKSLLLNEVRLKKMLYLEARIIIVS